MIGFANQRSTRSSYSFPHIHCAIGRAAVDYDVLDMRIVLAPRHSRLQSTIVDEPPLKYGLITGNEGLPSAARHSVNFMEGLSPFAFILLTEHVTPRKIALPILPKKACGLVTTAARFRSL